MLRKTRIRHLFAVLAALLALSAAAAARAHPLGNFTISRYSAVTLAGERAEVLYIVDMAEIPTFRERQTMDVDGDGAPSAAEQEAYLAALIPDLAANLSLTIDGSTVPLTPARHVLTFPHGQGGLPTMRLELWLTAALPAASAPLAVAYEDRNFADRLGWREIVVSAESGTLLDSSVPATDASDQLRDYPADLLQAPLAVSAATARYAPVGVPATTDAAPVPVTAPVAANRFSQDEFANLLSRTLDTPAALAAALLVAVGLGAAHALTPGHGKTIVGAYLVGSRGTARHALFLGLTTTITHTAGVFALGLLVLFASEFILPEKLYPWLGVLSGLLVVFIGLSIFRGHFRHWLAHRRGGDHDHGAYHFHLGKGHTHEHRPPTADGRPRSADGRRTTAGGCWRWSLPRLCPAAQERRLALRAASTAATGMGIPTTTSIRATISTTTATTTRPRRATRWAGAIYWRWASPAGCCRAPRRSSSCSAPSPCGRWASASS